MVNLLLSSLMAFKLNVFLPYNLVISLLVIYPKVWKIYVHVQSAHKWV